jgi:hypothetical protein
MRNDTRWKSRNQMHLSNIALYAPIATVYANRVALGVSFDGVQPLDNSAVNRPGVGAPCSELDLQLGLVKILAGVQVGHSFGTRLPFESHFSSR